ncbi:laccase [Grosmannia clavigera kw1407]|uniref:laccase n=1 Tax=Grosmannia clavigera (strain kw1407 / UAMH 11150) TaxID=655863 RepID=F0XJC5_GROCL|nr:laccase [Grosmannia clavigera kw1407]EFX02122.1 laccase [Grosmannia clavigera kw1407]
MRFFSALAAVSSLLSASSLTVLAVPELAVNSARASSCNTASLRSCWTAGFDINTDYMTSTPITGVTRTYDLTITQETDWTGPDGQVKSLVMLINGQFPGPVITADWGDTISVTVTNKLDSNGTSMHWHGIRQLNNNLQDGVNGVTECPIAPGSSRTYTFLAEQYGTTWYHSHFSAQYGNGVFGTLYINGPASANYDIDLGTFPVGDYYYDTADNLVEYTKNHGPPPSDNLLFNGTNVHPTKSGQGSYAKVTLTHGKSHRLRLVNPSVENHFALSLASHNFTIISSDLVPVEPTTVTQLFMGPGQRYDIIITADQDVDNYWFNATFSADGGCGSSINTAPAAIFHYSGATGSVPTDPGASISVPNCGDISDLKPKVSRTIPVSDFQEAAANTLPINLVVDSTGPALLTWKVNGTQINIDWNVPVVDYVMKFNTSYPQSDNIIRVPKASSAEWAFWLIENDPTFALAHPIHLHGHDFVVLGRSDPSDASPAAFDASSATLNGDNPMRRDVAMLPAKGWLLIAFRIDNPGVWLMHCHIAWHVSGGLGVTFLEDPDTFGSQVACSDKRAFKQTCDAWNNYYPSGDPFKQDDSGLRI